MNESNSSPPKSSKAGVRLIGSLLIGLLWVGVLCVGGELWDRLRERQLGALADAVSRQSWELAAVETRAICARIGLTEPPTQGSDIKARAAFMAADESTRTQEAQRRGEAVFVCNLDGAIKASYGVEAPEPAIAAYAKAAVAEKTVLAPLEGMQRDDAQAALGMPGLQFREYELSLSADGVYVAQFAFHPVPERSEVGVFVRPSMWKNIWQRFRPGVKQDDAYTIEINSHGFRDREIVVPKPAGLFRIVCIGGSTTAEGPTNELTYPKLLEQLLRERYGESRIEVINAGVFASRSGNELERMPDCLAMQPDLILHYNAVNDITQWLPVWMENDAYALPKSLARASHLVYNHANSWLLPSDDRLAEGIDEAIMGNLRGIAAAAQQAGVAVAFASFTAPDYANLPRDEQAYFDRLINTMHWGRTVNMESYVRVIDLYNQQLSKLCSELDMPYLPLAEGFKHGASIFTDICHMHPHGMLAKASILAETLAPYLESWELIPLPQRH